MSGLSVTSLLHAECGRRSSPVTFRDPDEVLPWMGILTDALGAHCPFV